MEILFIQGPEKTATSLLTGILNCHPEIFILFENYLSQSTITKYGNQVLNRYPDARHFYRNEEDFAKPVNDFFNYLREKEPDYKYKFVGTKINNLDPYVTQAGGPYKIIFTMRDIKSWLVKESVIKRYRTDLDVVIPAMEYLQYVVKSAKFNHAFRLRMEDLIQENDKMISSLSDYIGITLPPHTDKWWKKIGNRSEESPKSVFKLDHVHHSSRVKPGNLDTSVEIVNQPFWETVESIFQKYFRASGRPDFDKKEIERDLKSIKELEQLAPLPFTKCYSHVQSVRFGFNSLQEVYYLSDKKKTGSRRGYFSRVKHKIKRIANFILTELQSNRKWILMLCFYDEVKIAYELILVAF